MKTELCKDDKDCTLYFERGDNIKLELLDMNEMSVTIPFMKFIGCYDSLMKQYLSKTHKAGCRERV